MHHTSRLALTFRPEVRTAFKGPVAGGRVVTICAVSAADVEAPRLGAEAGPRLLPRRCRELCRGRSAFVPKRHSRKTGDFRPRSCRTSAAANVSYVRGRGSSHRGWASRLKVQPSRRVTSLSTQSVSRPTSSWRVYDAPTRAARGPQEGASENARFDRAFRIGGWRRWPLAESLPRGRQARPDRGAMPGARFVLQSSFAPDRHLVKTRPWSAGFHRCRPRFAGAVRPP
jgi:hypothetical protein